MSLTRAPGPDKLTARLSIQDMRLAMEAAGVGWGSLVVQLLQQLAMPGLHVHLLEMNR